MRVLLIITCLFVFFACSTEPNDDGIETGTVRYVELEGGFYGIYADNGEHYDPINLPEEFKIDGLRIEFTFIKRDDLASFHMWGCLIEIKDVKAKSNLLNEGFEIEVNQTFQVELISNVTTGYSWTWTNKDSVSILDTVGYEYVLDKPILMGSGGKEIWTFKGFQKGETKILFEYRRPWESNSTIDKKEIFVKVK
ncbi:MAG: protease inhibitor I42 family protein [Ignavibacteriales bacterium]|nr:protease inhibitor I42 family protein [Ignavibacteriales bacterium]